MECNGLEWNGAERNVTIEKNRIVLLLKVLPAGNPSGSGYGI